MKDLFTQAPFKFKPRKREEIDKAIGDHIEEMDIKIPIVWIKENIYLIGSQKLDFALDRNCLMIKPPTSRDDNRRSFQDYIIKNEKPIQKHLALLVLKSGEDLEQVLDNLIQDKKIENLLDQSDMQDKMDRKTNGPKELDWRKDPPRFAAPLGGGPKGPMKKRPTSAMNGRGGGAGGGGGPLDAMG